MEPEFYDEYLDLDAIACANGDYNTFEENQVFMDREWDDSPFGFDDYGDLDPDYEYECEY